MLLKLIPPFVENKFSRNITDTSSLFFLLFLLLLSLEDDDDKLIYNVAMNQAAREHREAEYREFFNPDLFS